MRRALVLLAVACLAGAASCSGSDSHDGGASQAAGGAHGGGPGTSGGVSSGAAGKAGNAGSGGSGLGAGTGGTASGGTAGSAGSTASGARGGTAGSGTAAAAGRAGSGGSSPGGSAGSGGSSGSAGRDGDAGAAGSGEEAGGSSGPVLTSFKLAVVGSSTAAGEGASSSSKGWVSLLASSLDTTVSGDFSASNLAVGGYTTSELLPDSGADGSIDDAIDRNPNLIIVALAGSNDLSAGTSTETFLARLTTLRDHARDAGIPVFFVSTAPKDLSTSEKQTLQAWGEQMKTKFSSCWVPGQSNDYSPCFIDIFELLANDSLGVASEYSAGDGIHLNDAGHEVIFEAARGIVEPYVCSRTACR
ncbi:MAG TPA: SGNH/GDSL hydrolase family protein [Polyangiaceae bacterium]|nr:SGNH/GDSL hydrolase family protein [Polyangiaceae bacterium]